MIDRRLRILQVNTADVGGGAANVAWNLHQAYRARGHPAWMVVGAKRTDDPAILVLDSDRYRNGWARFWIRAGRRWWPHPAEATGAVRLGRLAVNAVGQPRRVLAVRRGHEDFEFPASRRLLQLPPESAEIAHCHNLHGGYFDLRVLPHLAERVPTVLTLHDAWLLSGHCAHSLNCERWTIGCGHCPDLTLYPAVRRDATAHNWRRKQAIYANCRLYVATPSRWLMQKVERSVLVPALAGTRVIPNGVDLSVFSPAARGAARAQLGLPQEGAVLLFAAEGVRQNAWKDYRTLRAAVARVAERRSLGSLLCLALGEEAPSERAGPAEIRFVPYQRSPAAMANWYRAADLYVHAARADTFPNTVLEALACGTPVVATAVGGIPEQIKPLTHTVGAAGHRGHGPLEATGMLVPAGDAEGLAECIELLLTEGTLRSHLAANAVRDAGSRFDLAKQVDSYLDWYRELTERTRPSAAPATEPLRPAVPRVQVHP